MIKIMFGVAFGIVLAGLATMAIKVTLVEAVLEQFQPSKQEKELSAYQAEVKLEHLRQEQQQALRKQAIQAQRERDAIQNARQEQQFKAEYKKPAQCYNIQNHETRINCGNHYIRAKQDFAKKFITAQQNQITANR